MHYLQVRSLVTNEIYRQQIKEPASPDLIRQIANSLIQEYDIKTPAVSIIKRPPDSKEVAMNL